MTFVGNRSKWKVERWSKKENKPLFNGRYDNEKTAARASDVLAKKLMKSGEQTLKLNFPDDHNEVHAEKVTGNKFFTKIL